MRNATSVAFASRGVRRAGTRWADPLGQRILGAEVAWLAQRLGVRA